ncbi:type II toxin-antitoxin system RatA family toxin [Caldimonas aquatica]|uniref:Type II toxin-antitoxin system RatA family toxin n=1 Tax=Caldimonas aquatica TaxID=376175 RepID=A0ABY6MME7_9BURK|nr:type II toxin-antitoxin system RatA family toxin [Schlegelella aquatica]UZD53681.1 type II toxin-antitoxin system RatA family toxin [Schlegelella aquatica]
MKHVKKSVLLWYSAQEMYELVTRVRDYPSFLPWCEKAEVLEESGDQMTARLTLRYAGLHHAFTTRNTHVAGQSVVVTLVDGPFSLLEGEWRFVPLSAPGSPPACKVELDLRYAFSSATLQAIVSPVFDRIANTLVDSFVKRAEQVYGAR